MASLFGPRRRSPEEECGSGGKIVRRRRAFAPATPYQRPPPPPTPPQPQSPGWISGLISGAGKLISTVFRSERSSASDYSSDEDIISVSNGDEHSDADSSSQELQEANPEGKEVELARNSPQVTPRSGSKAAIERLIMQETFTRDECKKLKEILESRVVDCSSPEVGPDEPQKGILPSLSGNATPRPYSHPSAISPVFSVLQSRTPDLRTTAVMEAKKWLEEKKLSSSSNENLNQGPDTLNTDTRNCGIEGETGSPVDMAKSYMCSLPLWQSPPLYSIGGFKTPPPSGSNLYKDGSSHITANYSLPSSKFFKRNYLETGAWDTPDEIRRVRMKSANDISEPSHYRQIDPSSKLSDYRSPIISSAAEGRELHAEDQYANRTFSSTYGKNILGNNPANEGSEKRSTELHAEDQYRNGALSLPYEKATEGNNPENAGSFSAFSINSETEEALDAGKSTNESELAAVSAPSHCEKGSATKLPESVQILVENQDMGEPSQTGYHVLVSSPAKHYGNLPSEPKPVTPEEVKSATPSDDDDVINLHLDYPPLQTESVNGERPQDDKPATAELLEGHEFVDTRNQDETAKFLVESNGGIDEIAANSAFEDANKNLDYESLSKEDPSHTDDPAEHIPEETHEHLSEPAVDSSVQTTNDQAGKPLKGRRMKSIERMLTETQPGPSLRGRKAVDKSKRGRGRGRGRARGRGRVKSES